MLGLICPRTTRDIVKDILGLTFPRTIHDIVKDTFGLTFPRTIRDIVKDMLGLSKDLRRPPQGGFYPPVFEKHPP